MAFQLIESKCPSGNVLQKGCGDLMLINTYWRSLFLHLIIGVTLGWLIFQTVNVKPAHATSCSTESMLQLELDEVVVPADVTANGVDWPQTASLGNGFFMGETDDQSFLLFEGAIP